MVMRIMTRERQRKTPRPNFCLGFIWDFWRTRMGMLMTVVSERGMLISWFPFVFSVVFGKESGERGRKRSGIFTHHVRNDVEDCSQNVQIQKNVSVIEAFNYSRKKKKIHSSAKNVKRSSCQCKSRMKRKWGKRRGKHLLDPNPKVEQKMNDSAIIKAQVTAVHPTTTQ